MELQTSPQIPKASRCQLPRVQHHPVLGNTLSAQLLLASGLAINYGRQNRQGLAERRSGHEIRNWTQSVGLQASAFPVSAPALQGESERGRCHGRLNI